MKENNYCKSYGLSCRQCHYKNCIDSRGRYAIYEKEMDIKIGDVVKFKIGFKSQLGTVVEIAEVKESINSEKVGAVEYHVSTLDNTINNFTLEKKEIENVYRMVGSNVNHLENELLMKC